MPLFKAFISHFLYFQLFHWVSFTMHAVLHRQLSNCLCKHNIYSQQFIIAHWTNARQMLKNQINRQETECPFWICCSCTWNLFFLNVKIHSLKRSVKTTEKILHMYRTCSTDKTCLSPDIWTTVRKLPAGNFELIQKMFLFNTYSQHNLFINSEYNLPWGLHPLCVLFTTHFIQNTKIICYIGELSFPTLQ